MSPIKRKDRKDMADDELRPDDWRRVHGGLRGSVLLRAGAVLGALSLLVETACRILVPDLDPGVSGPLIGSWLGWIASLTVLGLGFLWTGTNPLLSRFGIVVGAFHVLHAVFLVVRIFTDFHLPVPPRILVVGRLALVLTFALVERGELGARGRLLLAAAAFALARTVAAAWNLPPGLGPAGDALYHFLSSFLLVLAIYGAGQQVKRREDESAAEFLDERQGGFDQFNNPLHRWRDTDR